jgi:predicted DNA-binding protein
MVTVAIRIDPVEREQLENMAEQQGDTLCAFLRNLIRRELSEDGACTQKHV